MKSTTPTQYVLRKRTTTSSFLSRESTVKTEPSHDPGRRRVYELDIRDKFVYDNPTVFLYIFNTTITLIQNNAGCTEMQCGTLRIARTVCIRRVSHLSLLPASSCTSSRAPPLIRTCHSRIPFEIKIQDAIGRCYSSGRLTFQLQRLGWHR